jgi:hypothetical protein
VPIFLTDNVMLYDGTYDNCCTIGYHGAGMPIGHGAGSANGKGNNPVQTFIYSAWSKPGTYSGFYSDYSGTRSYPSPTRGIADIHALSHEVAEWRRSVREQRGRPVADADRAAVRLHARPRDR